MLLITLLFASYQNIPKQPALRQLLDVYYDADDLMTKKPVIVWIHGGAWKFGNKSHSLTNKAPTFTEEGYVFVAINYRFHPDVTWREQASDVAAACKWVTQNISRYGGNPDSLILMGHSAGAHLAALTGADHSYLRAQKISMAKVRAVILLDGAGYDLPSVMQASHGLHLRVYKDVFGNNPKELKAASPISHFSKGQLSPAYFIVPVEDRALSVEQSEKLAAKINSSGNRASVYLAKDRNHTTLNKKLGELGDAPTQAILNFLSKLLK